MLNTRASRRSAFTLVEILVVLGIILLLLGISIAAAMKVTSARKRKLTQSSLDSLYAVLMSHQKAVIDDARQETGNYGPGSPAFEMAGRDMNRAQVIWIKKRLLQQFPTSYPEALNLNLAGSPRAEPSYTTKLSTKTNPNFNLAKTKVATQSAACLLMALTARDRRGVNVSAGYLGSLQVADTDGDGIPEIVDLWGNPIAFARWPLPTDTTQSDGNYQRINSWDPNYSTKRFHDPQDPFGTLQAPTWMSSRESQDFQDLIHRFGGPYPGMYFVPLIASAGPDGVLGLDLSRIAGTVDMGVNPTILNQRGEPAYLDNIYADPTSITP
jgi:type II secretory pathway pseudopilin PulG